jgi:hypothetical protein
MASYGEIASQTRLARLHEDAYTVQSYLLPICESALLLITAMREPASFYHHPFSLLFSNSTNLLPRRPTEPGLGKRNLEQLVTLYKSFPST